MFIFLVAPTLCLLVTKLSTQITIILELVASSKLTFLRTIIRFMFNVLTHMAGNHSSHCYFIFTFNLGSFNSFVVSSFSTLLFASIYIVLTTPSRTSACNDVRRTTYRGHEPTVLYNSSTAVVHASTVQHSHYPLHYYTLV